MYAVVILSNTDLISVMLLLINAYFQMYGKYNMLIIFSYITGYIPKYIVHFLVPKCSNHIFQFPTTKLSLTNGNEFHSLKWPLNTHPPYFKKSRITTLRKITAFNGRNCPSPRKTIDTTLWPVSKKLSVCVRGTLTDGQQ